MGLWICADVSTHSLPGFYVSSVNIYLRGLFLLVQQENEKEAKEKRLKEKTKSAAAQWCFLPSQVENNKKFGANLSHFNLNIFGILILSSYFTQV